jgi:hypothetical protein
VQESRALLGSGSPGKGGKRREKEKGREHEATGDRGRPSNEGRMRELDKNKTNILQFVQSRSDEGRVG